MDFAGKKISEFENGAIETIQLRHGGGVGGRLNRMKQRISKLRDNITWSNIHVTRVPEGEQKAKLWNRML